MTRGTTQRARRSVAAKAGRGCSMSGSPTSSTSAARPTWGRTARTLSGNDTWPSGAAAPTVPVRVVRGQASIGGQHGDAPHRARDQRVGRPLDVSSRMCPALEAAWPPARVAGSCRLWTRRFRGNASASLLVVETGLQDDQVLAVDETDEAVLLIDPSGPGAGQGVPELLGLPWQRGERRLRALPQGSSAARIPTCCAGR